MRNKLLNNRLTVEQRDVLKGKILAREDFETCINYHATVDDRKEFLLNEDSFHILTDALIKENNEREETKIIARIKEFEKLKKQYLKEHGATTNH